jgi:hypothetical protein
MSITTRKYDNLDDWFKALSDEQKKYMRSDDKATGPKGAGYVFRLQGRHFHDEGKNQRMRGVPYVENTFLKELQQWTHAQFDVIKLEATGQQIPVRQMGITHPTIVETMLGNSVIYLKNGPGGEAPGVRAAGNGGRGGARNKGAKKKPVADDAEADEESEKIPLTDFVIEFAWVYVSPDKRLPEDPALKKTDAAPAGGAPTTGAPAAGAPTTGASPGAAGGSPPAAAGGAQPAGGSPPSAAPAPGGTNPGGTNPTPNVSPPK